MFGYIKPFQPELRVKELDAYKAVYCGLCGQLGRSYGPAARLTLSYDFTFVAMVYWAVVEEAPVAVKRRCYVNPLKKMVICTGGRALEYSADIAAILLYYKLMDNIQDSGIFGKIGWTFLRPVASGAFKKASAAQSEVKLAVEQAMLSQKELEKKHCGSVDAACEPSAAALGAIFAGIPVDDSRKRVLERLGYLIGRFVYLCDALDDMEDDVRTGSYNPFAVQHSLKKGEKDGWQEARDQAVSSLNMTIGEACATFALLEMHDFIPIIENIVTMGLKAGVQEIIAKKEIKSDE